MKLVGTKMVFFRIQGIKLKRRIRWYPQWQQIITEMKLPDARPTTPATVQIECARGDSRLDFDVSRVFLIVSIILIVMSFGSLVGLSVTDHKFVNIKFVDKYWQGTPLFDAGIKKAFCFILDTNLRTMQLWTELEFRLVENVHRLGPLGVCSSSWGGMMGLSSEISCKTFIISLFQMMKNLSKVASIWPRDHKCKIKVKTVYNRLITNA